ncbi:hypothetical protein [Streptomyces lavendofoliae]|uniref:hypothetical protein n=1 Tax=Streptomyces lavendofoliae TaxID=67314 RepID=UPI003D936687
MSAILTSWVAADVINFPLEHARAAAAVIRARVTAVVDIALAAVDVTATVFVMNDGGRFHRQHLLAEARRHLALVPRGRRRDPGLDDRIVAAAISTHCLDISEPKTVRGLEAGYRLYTARWALYDLPSRRRPTTPAPDPDRQPPADPGEPAVPGPWAGMRGSGRSPASRCTSAPSSPARWWCGRSCAPPPPSCGVGVRRHRPPAGGVPDQLLAAERDVPPSAGPLHRTESIRCAPLPHGPHRMDGGAVSGASLARSECP